MDYREGIRETDKKSSKVILQEIAELVYRKLSPNPSDETAIQLPDLIASARQFYATLVFQNARSEKNNEGFFDVPSYLLTETEKEVVENTIDISDFKALKSLPNEGYILNIGGLTCSCEYVKSTVNRTALLCDDEALENFKTWYIIGNKIKFPKGTHRGTLSVLYANNGSEVDELIYIDESLSGLLMDKLSDAYNIQRIGKEDETNNSSSIS